jgi:hypothetical protein
LLEGALQLSQFTLTNSTLGQGRVELGAYRRDNAPGLFHDVAMTLGLVGEGLPTGLYASNQPRRRRLRVRLPTYSQPETKPTRTSRCDVRLAVRQQRVQGRNRMQSQLWSPYTEATSGFGRFNLLKGSRWGKPSMVE